MNYQLTLEFAGDKPKQAARYLANATHTKVTFRPSPNGNLDVTVTGKRENVINFAKEYDPDDGENLFNEFAVEVQA